MTAVHLSWRVSCMPAVLWQLSVTFDILLLKSLLVHLQCTARVPNLNFLCDFVFMAALRSRCGFIFLPCGFFYLSSSFFFLRLISAVGDWMSTILTHMVWLYSANLRCRSETWCKWLAENTGRKKSCQKSPSWHHRTTLSGYIFSTKALIVNRKK